MLVDFKITRMTNHAFLDQTFSIILTQNYKNCEKILKNELYC